MLFEAEVLPGLKPFAEAELAERFDEAVVVLPVTEADSLAFSGQVHRADLLALRTVVAVYDVLHFDIPRPKALLGDQHFRRLTGAIDRVRGLNPSGSFSSFRFNAAGRQSTVFDRLRDAVAGYTHLDPEPEEADLLIRVRPALLHPTSWEVLVRLTPRPLAARAWRVCDFEGAINASIAAAMVALTTPTASDRVLNLACGSATLLIERAAAGAAASLTGVDNNRAALECARQNIAAAGCEADIELIQGDITALDVPDAAYDVLLSDLPWGSLVGSAGENRRLYPAALDEAARVTRPGGQLALITHEIRLMDSLLPRFSGEWDLHSRRQVYQGGLHPHIYHLIRRDSQ